MDYKFVIEVEKAGVRVRRIDEEIGGEGECLTYLFQNNYGSHGSMVQAAKDYVAGYRHGAADFGARLDAEVEVKYT